MYKYQKSLRNKEKYRQHVKNTHQIKFLNGVILTT